MPSTMAVANMTPAYAKRLTNTSDAVIHRVLVTEIVPVQVDLLQLFSFDALD